jgi:hypothetical protein
MEFLNPFFDFVSEAVNAALVSPIGTFVLITSLVIAVFAAILFTLRSILHAQTKAGRAFHRTILLVRVPKEKKSDKQDGGGEDNINQVREQIAVADTFFSAIAGLHKEKGLSKWLRLWRRLQTLVQMNLSAFSIQSLLFWVIGESITSILSLAFPHARFLMHQ